MPILWHIMKSFYHHGIDDFVICLGYKGYMIKEFFANYHLHTNDLTIDFKTGATLIHNQRSEQWKVTLVDTGAESMTGGRLKRVARYLGEEHFCMTYGDGLADIDIRELVRFHHQQGRDATVTVVSPPGRFGAVDISGNAVSGFREKPVTDDGWINAGFFVLAPKVLDLIDGDDTVWERGPLETLAEERQLSAYRHTGFWQPMDTLRDKNQLEGYWASGRAPWRSWS